MNYSGKYSFISDNSVLVPFYVKSQNPLMPLFMSPVEKDKVFKMQKKFDDTFSKRLNKTIEIESIKEPNLVCDTCYCFVCDFPVDNYLQHIRGEVHIMKLESSVAYSNFQRSKKLSEIANKKSGMGLLRNDNNIQRIEENTTVRVIKNLENHSKKKDKSKERVSWSFSNLKKDKPKSKRISIEKSFRKSFSKLELKKTTPLKAVSPMNIKHDKALQTDKLSIYDYPEEELLYLKIRKDYKEEPDIKLFDWERRLNSSQTLYNNKHKPIINRKLFIELRSIKQQIIGIRKTNALDIHNYLKRTKY